MSNIIAPVKGMKDLCLCEYTMGSKYSLVFVGPKGNGKSSTANTIAEKNLFTTGNRCQTVTLTVAVEYLVRRYFVIVHHFLTV